MNADTVAVSLGILFVAVGVISFFVLITGALMTISPNTRRVGSRLALWSGIALLVSAGLCFGTLPFFGG